MVNRYGPWLDTNWVTPTGPDSCVVVFDYYLEPELANDAKFIAESLVGGGVCRLDHGSCSASRDCVRTRAFPKHVETSFTPQHL